ncbi:serine carboxypeptidase-like 3 isoform X2 [Brachypodium distachyon]|uniref:serine carboxypeptidase-like 3 isoform X2 n=1 Tax=Brachypodium distachyon TaxID=15368 RepID=UPI00071D8181|nr:serine carboxypeptidase-like 3 isoform X2 [Brachypodium distachyon]|eukprot:XP_014757513.1 serine carboxypeptidase-like 3 isoform X2 [Brachypodium distachyon]
MPRPTTVLLLLRLLLVSLLCFSSAALPLPPRFVSAEAPPTVQQVAALPGFDGALPFRLETGYLAVDEDNGAELFYYFIESEGDPRRDPVLLWLNGGDHCTVLSAIFFEIAGPLKLVVEPYNGTGVPRLRYHPYSWTKAASVLFVDSPVGSGFSFSRNPQGYDVGDVSSSLQLKEFLTKWFAEHPDYLVNPFYVGGDSYAGKIVPFLVQKISEGGYTIQTWTSCYFSDIEAGLKPTVNLKGYLVGNPVTGDRVDHGSRVPFLHGAGIISDQLYEAIMDNCQGEDYTKPKNALCAQALERFKRLLNEIWKEHILYKKCISVSARPNDGSTGRKILKEETGLLKHPPPRPPMECLSYVNYLSYFWANNNITRKILGIKKGTVDEWVRCHDGDLPFKQDIDNSIKYHRNVTSKGYRALIYSGDHDATIPFLGTQSWVRSLNFPIVDDWRVWHLHGQSAGFTITYRNNMTFATIKGGGHTAPEFQPERCFAMFKRWISNEPL